MRCSIRGVLVRPRIKTSHVSIPPSSTSILRVMEPSRRSSTDHFHFNKPLLYQFIVSMFPVSIRLSKTAEAGSRAGTLALITLIPLLAGTHHALLADLLGVSLQTIRLIHRSTGVAICLLHVLFALTSKVSFSLDNTQDLFAVIVGIYLQANS